MENNAGEDGDTLLVRAYFCVVVVVNLSKLARLTTHELPTSTHKHRCDLAPVSKQLATLHKGTHLTFPSTVYMTNKLW